MTNDQVVFAQAELHRVILKLHEQGIEVLASGMALGTDQWAALAAVEVGMVIEAHLPFPSEEQGKFWNPTDKAVHAALVAQAETVCCYGDGKAKFDLIPAYHRRNQGLVDRVAKNDKGLFIAVTNGKGSGGTWDCLHRIAATNRDTIVIHTALGKTARFDPIQLAEVLQLDPHRITEHRRNEGAA